MRLSVVVRRDGRLSLLMYRVRQGRVTVEAAWTLAGWSAFFADVMVGRDLLGGVKVVHVQAEERITIVGKLERGGN